jgi:hypothetical protein
LLAHFEREGRRLVEDFASASEKGEGTSQEVADHREAAFRHFLRRHLPATQTVVKGQILDIDGYLSNSIDCVILSPQHPWLSNGEAKPEFILADGVDFVVEVKPDVAPASELNRGLGQLVSVNRRVRSRSSVVSTSCPPEEKSHSFRIPTFMFAETAPADLEEFGKSILSYYADKKTPRIEQFDFLVVNRSGILVNQKSEQFNRWKSLFDDVPHGLFFEHWDDATLTAMLFYMSSCYAAYPKLSSDVFQRYLAKAVGRVGVTYLGTSENPFEHADVHEADITETAFE